MEYQSIHIQGNIVSTEILDKIRTEDIKFQQAADFGLDPKSSVRDEIGVAWSATRMFWTAFRLRADRLKDGESGVSETRSSWIIPLLQQLGYTVEKAPAFIHPDTKKSYAISHRASNLGGFPIHIMGINDDLDKRRENSGPRLSPHALVQEYLNNDEHTYALVTNGGFLRLLRDATRLVRLSYLEFDLKKMMEEELYSDFALMFRLLHATRMPKQVDAVEESDIEFYHQESLASGSRIRERLSNAVESSIKVLANGFLQHPANEDLREKIRGNRITSADYYQLQLRLIYRLLFLIVTEERHLVYPETRDPELQRKRSIYYDFYSIERLRKLAIKIHYVDPRKHDLWEGLRIHSLIFEEEIFAQRLGIKPLGSGLFASEALGMLPQCKLDNETLLRVIRHLTLFENDQKQLVRVNYSDLDVEEFGSVYEGLLEYDAAINDQTGNLVFSFVQGTGRSSSGSHYTPEELVKPLIKHSLDYIIEEKLKEADQEKALLSIKVCDVACGSGHILLSAARRIAIEVARVRTGEDQPTPTAMRSAIRGVIKSCIYGVDKNPLAVELCKVALWLEAHNPGDPLNFLDHHIKCGDSIVGMAHKEELANGIPDEAFKTLPGDDKDVASSLRKQNKQERESRQQRALPFEQKVNQHLVDVLTVFEQFNAMPESTPQEIAAKEAAYKKLIDGPNWWRLKKLADLQVAQFFIPKTSEKRHLLTTDGTYYEYLRGERIQEDPRSVGEAVNESHQRHFFHWFLEFPEVFSRGGFDCVIGNPPFLGNRKLSGTFGDILVNWLLFVFRPTKVVELVTYFFRRAYQVSSRPGFVSLIATNTISQGDARECGLDHIIEHGGAIIFTLPSIRWPGRAVLHVSLVTIHNGNTILPRYIRDKRVSHISTLLLAEEEDRLPRRLKCNAELGFIGTVLGGDGFILESAEYDRLSTQAEYLPYIKPYLTGADVNRKYDMSPSRHIIDLGSLSLQEASRRTQLIDIVKARVKPKRDVLNRKAYRERWWQFAEKCEHLYDMIVGLKSVLVTARTSKTHAFALVNNGAVFADALVVIASDDLAVFAILSSTIHESWARKYCTTMKTDMNYGPTRVLETYPLPIIDSAARRSLRSVGEKYSQLRFQIMLKSRLGLTKIYNVFHDVRSKHPSMLIEDEEYAFASAKKAESSVSCSIPEDSIISTEDIAPDVQRLRELHIELDNEVLQCYGWGDIQLRHDFYEVDYLPEDDRVRFTIHPAARREILKRLLELNYKIHSEEEAQKAANPLAAKPKSKPRQPKPDNGTEKLF